MDQQMRHHQRPTGHHLGLCLALAFGLTLGTQAAAAKERAREAPLPTNVRLVAPGPEVTKVVARFAGVWTGAWEHTGGLCHTLVVEGVLANGHTRVIYSYGTSVTRTDREPPSARGRILDAPGGLDRSQRNPGERSSISLERGGTHGIGTLVSSSHCPDQVVSV
jgi:hypothetical protein